MKNAIHATLAAVAFKIGAGATMDHRVLAETTDMPIAVLTAHNGTVAPKYRRQRVIRIHADGRIEAETCDHGPGPCRLASERAEAEAIGRIITAVRESGVLDRPVSSDPIVPVGGGSVSVTLTLDGMSVRLPEHPAPADAARVRAIMEAIDAAIPPDLSGPL